MRPQGCSELPTVTQLLSVARNKANRPMMRPWWWAMGVKGLVAAAVVVLVARQRCCSGGDRMILCVRKV